MVIVRPPVINLQPTPPVAAPAGRAPTSTTLTFIIRESLVSHGIKAAGCRGRGSNSATREMQPSHMVENSPNNRTVASGEKCFEIPCLWQRPQPGAPPLPAVRKTHHCAFFIGNTVNSKPPPRGGFPFNLNTVLTFPCAVPSAKWGILKKEKRMFLLENLVCTTHLMRFLVHTHLVYV